MAVDLHGCILAILVEDGADAVQIERLREMLHGDGAKVHLLGAQSNPAKTLSGATLSVDALASGVSPRYYDGFIIPGGASNRNPDVNNSEELIALLQAIAQERRVIGAIGEGARLLADAGLLEGRRVACSDAISKIIDETGAKRVTDAVATDRVIITARDSAAIPAFVESFAREIKAYRMRDYVDEVSIESFPGSDAPSHSGI